jgi:hypothetical protein
MEAKSKGSSSVDGWMDAAFSRPTPMIVHFSPENKLEMLYISFLIMGRKQTRCQQRPRHRSFAVNFPLWLRTSQTTDLLPYLPFIITSGYYCLN